MKLKRLYIYVFIVVLMISFCVLWFGADMMSLNAKGAEPVLSDADVYYDNTGTYLLFEVTYQDSDDNPGDVYLYIDYEGDDNYVEVQMQTMDLSSPSSGQLYEAEIQESLVYDYTAFYFYAEDSNGDYTFLPSGEVVYYVGDFLGWNSEPLLINVEAWTENTEVFFAITYLDSDGDLGSVFLILDGTEHEMQTIDSDPVVGQYYWIGLPQTQVEDEMEFYYYAEDNNGSFTYLPEGIYVYLVGDFLGWGDPPVLSNPDVYYDGDNYIFNVTYQDPEGHAADDFELHLSNSTDYKVEYMSSIEGNPMDGQNFQVSVPDSEIDEYWEFYFYTSDINGSSVYLYDTSGENFLVGPFLENDEDVNGGGDGGDGGDGGEGTKLGAGWIDNPEVMVGLIALVAVAGGSAYGVYRRKKKQGRFSALLTDLDEVYKSYKMNPHKCEIELEKMRALVNEDLKKGVIDENNYSILKERIDELIREIRSDSLHTQVKDIPKELELRIKDMLIDGEISRAEYDKLLPIIMGSEMASEDKKRVEKVVESWMKEDEKAEEEK